MRYDLNKLEWQQFEQLAFNCLQELISPSLHFIEGGNDKGRDFIYNGLTNFFSKDAISKKYVFQAKHKSNTQNRSALKTDLAKELKKVFIENALDYDVYCLVTNLTISGNFLDELNEIFNTFIEEHTGFEDVKFELISYRHLETTLDKNKYLKYRYATTLNHSDLEHLLDITLKRARHKTTEVWRSIFKKNADRFIYTSIQDRAIKVVKEKNIILFSGPPKSGKTFNAQALIFYLCCLEGFTPFYVVDLNSFEELYEEESNQIFLFDDAFGKHNLDKSRSDILERKLEQIFESIDKKHLFVFTSREYVYRSFQRLTDQDTSKFIQKITVQVTELSLTEKESLFERYYKTAFGNSYSFEQAQIDTYINHENFSPETIRSYFDNASSFNLLDFWEHLKKPDEYLATVFRNLDEEKKQTLLAVLFGLNGEEKNIEYTFKNILSDMGNNALINLSEQLSVLEDSIISRKAERYEFYHPSMTEFFLRYLSYQAGNHKTLAFKNINLELLSFIRFSESRNDELQIKISVTDLAELSTGFERITSNPNSELNHLNSVFSWVSSEDVMLNLQINYSDKYRALKQILVESLSREKERSFIKFDIIEFDYLMKNLKRLYSQKTLIQIFDLNFISRIIHSNLTSNNLWIVVFHLAQFIDSKETLLKVIEKDWLNQFYLDLKEDINNLGSALFGSGYPEFSEISRCKALIKAGKNQEAARIKKRTYGDYKHKTQKTWYPKYLLVKRKMNALKNSKPHGYLIYERLERDLAPIRRLEDNQRNRYFFLLNKGIWT